MTIFDEGTFFAMLMAYEPEPEPNYPLPVVPRRVGFMPADPKQIEPAPYWYVSTEDYLWTFFGGGLRCLVEEKRDGDNFYWRVPPETEWR